MIVITDNIKTACEFLAEEVQWQSVFINDLNIDIFPLAKRIFSKDEIFIGEFNGIKFWNYLMITDFSESSQYDILIKASDEINNLPDKILCLAASGNKFHGFRNRKWESPKGNIYLSVYLKPDCEIVNISLGFLILSAISVVQAIDSFDDLKNKSKIKWVNDILINGAKVAGVLAHTHIQGNIVKDAILGIGINVETKPDVAIERYVPAVSCLKECFDKSITLQDIFSKLIDSIENNYNELKKGNYSGLFKTYKDNSLIIGKKVRIWSDETNKSPAMLFDGIVTAIDDNLALTLDGVEDKVRTGRVEIIRY